jgi:hypothetical protein
MRKFLKKIGTSASIKYGNMIDSMNRAAGLFGEDQDCQLPIHGRMEMVTCPVQELLDRQFCVILNLYVPLILKGSCSLSIT